MKAFLQEYLKIIAYTLLGIVFAYASFYMFLNLYHFEEISEVHTLDLVNSQTHKDIQTGINQINGNINYDINNYTGNLDKQLLLGLQGRLRLCAQDLGSDDYFEFVSKGSYTIMDSQEIINIYNSKVANSCIVLQITDFFAQYNEQLQTLPEFDVLYDFSQIETKQLVNSMNYIENSLKNNSSYYFNSETATNTTFNQVTESISSIMFNYNRAVEYVIEISEFFEKEVTK